MNEELAWIIVSILLIIDIIWIGSVITDTTGKYRRK